MPFTSNNHIPGTVIDYNKPIYLLLYSCTSIFQLFLVYLLFRIKRFKNGFPFLLKRYAIIVTLISAGTVLIFVTGMKSIGKTSDAFIAYFFLTGVLIIGVGVFIWIRRGIKIFYKRKIKEHNIELFERELSEKEDEIRRLTEQNDILRIANHKTNHRLSALEHSIAGLLIRTKNESFSMETSEELAVTLEDIKRLTQDYQNDISKIKSAKYLQSTKIKMIDNIIEYFSKQCSESNVNFNFKTNGSIPYMVENIIAQVKLETMIGDHLQNALIAINAGDNFFRSILVILGLMDNCYEFTIFDSGIPFEVDTLIQLGTKFVTTHADTGGSGIGFMTTFKAMRECNASLIIHEKMPSASDFTKSITVRFDGENQYIIKTYRPDDFPKQNEKYQIINGNIQV